MNIIKSIFVIACIVLPGTVLASGIGNSCAALQKEYPQYVNKTLVQDITPHTPGFESLDPNDPSKYIGFDIDLGKEVGKCLGFKIRYKPVSFAALIPTLQAGHADFLLSDIWATPIRAKQVNFITYGNAYDGALALKGNPDHITGFNTSFCGHTAAENTGFVEIDLVKKAGEKCASLGKKPPHVLLFANDAESVQAVLTGRASAFMEDNYSINEIVKKYPNKLENIRAITMPYKLGLGIAKSKNAEFAAFEKAMKLIQSAGIEKQLLAKWKLPTSLEYPAMLFKG